MMDPHARSLDDALAGVARALEARSSPRRDAAREYRPGGVRPQEQSIGPGKGLGSSPGSSNGRDTHGSNAAKARHHWVVAGRNLPARSAFKIDPLTAVIVALVGVVAFQQVSARIDRAHGNPQMIKLVYPGAEGLRDSRL